MRIVQLSQSLQAHLRPVLPRQSPPLRTNLPGRRSVLLRSLDRSQQCRQTQIWAKTSSRTNSKQLNSDIEWLENKQSDDGSEREMKCIIFEESGNHNETEIESESSDSSTVLSQSEVSGQNYNVDDIKLFLKSTINKRGVQVKEYLADLKQFTDKSKRLMAEGCITNKEI